MNIQSVDKKMIPITKIRKDIDVLTNAIEHEHEAYVMRNQDILFIALSPELYQKFKQNGPDRSVSSAIEQIAAIRRSSPRWKTKVTVSDYVSKMRDERVRKWKK